MAESEDPPSRPAYLRPWPLVAAGVAIAAVAAVTTGFVVHHEDSGVRSTASLVAALNSTRCPATTIADEVLPSVVTISIQTSTSSSNGSGEVIRDNGYILTNDHVISPAGNGGTIDAVFSDGQTERATLVGRATGLDLAVVKVNAPQKLPVIAFGHSDSLVVGQPVVALGSPLGLSGTVTSGIVSALGRDVPVPADNGQTALLPGAIQTDASINPGNSGGALVDCHGALVGVNTAIATVPNAAGQAGGGSVGIGFAIPVDLATVVADQLIATGRFTAPYFGASTTPIPPSAASRFGISGGLYVQSVSAGGPAAEAGLRPGDVITHVAGHATTRPDSLFLATLTNRAGDKVSVDYVRNGTTATTMATLAAHP
jgi:putative serine protease PepD